MHGQLVCGTCGLLLTERDSQGMRYGNYYDHIRGCYTTCLYANGYGDHGKSDLKWFNEDGIVYIADPKPFTVATKCTGEFTSAYQDAKFGEKIKIKKEKKESVIVPTVPAISLAFVVKGRKFKVDEFSS